MRSPTLSRAQNQECMNEVHDAAVVFTDVVLPYVVADRLDEGSAESSARKKDKVAKGKSVDVRPVRLMTISGKGG